MQQVAQHVEAPPVGHAYFDALDAMLSAAPHHLLQPWQQGLRALHSKPLQGRELCWMCLCLAHSAMV